MRVETLKDARIAVNLLPSSIRLASEAIGRDVGRVARGEKSRLSANATLTLSHRIVELAEARVMLGVDGKVISPEEEAARRHAADVKAGRVVVVHGHRVLV